MDNITGKITKLADINRKIDSYGRDIDETKEKVSVLSEKNEIIDGLTVKMKEMKTRMGKLESELNEKNENMTSKFTTIEAEWRENKKSTKFNEHAPRPQTV